MRPYRVGILGCHTAIDYPRSLRLGVQNALEEAGHTLVTITDLVPYHTRTNAESYLRVACEVAARLDLDMVIYPVGCLAQLLKKGDNDGALELLRILNPAKTLVVGRSVPGYHCITKDNVSGMHDCMRHLIEDCGFTKIAFISGPEGSFSAHERESVYFKEMEAHGLEVDPRRFARGSFDGLCEDAVEKILDDNPDIEAIACACDLIAYAVYAVMRKRGLMVGKDIAVTGFDDNPRSALMDPPLSTVRMTSYDLGYVAGQEALRLCAGLELEQTVMRSTFVARSSCGESARNTLEYFRTLLRTKPVPVEKFVDVLMESTISMAGPRVRNEFHCQMVDFFQKVRVSYLRHVEDPRPDDLLFSSQDLATLFQQDYRDYLSFEGFHNAAITLLEALLEESPPEDVNWVVEQISHLHLRIARLLNTTTEANALEGNRREWVTFHSVDDALREDRDPATAYRLILEEYARLGMDQLDLFLLPEPVEFVGVRQFALSDTVVPLGSLSSGVVTVEEDAKPIVMQDMLSRVLPRYDQASECVVGGILAGNELMGIACMNSRTLSDHDQLMAFVSLGFSLKHLQMMANEREMNELLNRNNLLLRQESQHDEMTGLLNRRGLMNRAHLLEQTHLGRTVAILYLDLDGLKTINDTFGHEQGDEAIRATAHVLRQTIPAQDVVGRLGGDEFVALVGVSGQGELDKLLRDIQDNMRAYNETHDEPFELAISAGAALFSVDRSTLESIDTLMMQADEQLYEMKRHRKGSRRFEA
ncbi:MAG: GGDEF domain-containing protein [Coriobacteriales bacterium]|nr:GGDEF domain-containing protein [Coriobacteriales bacterium]